MPYQLMSCSLSAKDQRNAHFEIGQNPNSFIPPPSSRGLKGGAEIPPSGRMSGAIGQSKDATQRALVNLTFNPFTPTFFSLVSQHHLSCGYSSYCVKLLFRYSTHTSSDPILLIDPSN